MRRREFIALVGGAATWPLTARAQLDRVRRIGVLMGQGLAQNDLEAQSSVAAFREELRKLGWTEGPNIEIDTRWANGDVESMKRFAKEFVVLQPDLIVTSSIPATAAMLQQTRTIPIIFVLVADPVGSGFVTNLSRPRRRRGRRAGVRRVLPCGVRAAAAGGPRHPLRSGRKRTGRPRRREAGSAGCRRSRGVLVDHDGLAVEHA